MSKSLPCNVNFSSVASLNGLSPVQNYSAFLLDLRVNFDMLCTLGLWATVSAGSPSFFIQLIYWFLFYVLTFIDYVIF